MPLSRDQARELARWFRDLSVELGTFRFDHWGELSPAQRHNIESAEWTLLNYSSDFITSAVGLALNDVASDLAAIRKATASAKKVIAKISNVKTVLTLVAEAIALGGAIAAKSPGAIVAATGDLLSTIGGLKSA